LYGAVFKIAHVMMTVPNKFYQIKSNQTPKALSQQTAKRDP
jgi:hypothetical protein